jgi:predicted DCC family thiol-disulfide oxidoreductase YuxK
MLLFLKFPWNVFGYMGIIVPAFIRDAGYHAFARNRGAIWRGVKRVTGMNDTQLHAYRDKILGLEGPLPEEWGFSKKGD